MRFIEKLNRCITRNKSHLCVGLDPDIKRIPPKFLKLKNPIYSYNRMVIENTRSYVCAYKPNIAFFEAAGKRGLEALERTLAFIPSHIPVILDAKRNDIGHSASQYAKALFEYWDVDATTVNPLLGHDTVQPFLDYSHKFVFLICLTSNPGAQDYLTLPLKNNSYLFESIAYSTQQWYNRNKNCGLVVGATWPHFFKKIKKIAPQCPLLIPGIGTQGGDLAGLRPFLDQPPSPPIVINVSRDILYPQQAHLPIETAIAGQASKYQQLIQNLFTGRKQ